MHGTQSFRDAASTPARQRYYVWGNYVDELLMFNDDAGDDSDYFLCYNQIFSPEATVDSTGAIVERYDYDAYGKPIIYTADGGDSDWWDGDETTATASAKGLVYLFTGREYESLDSAGLPLQYSRARYYSFPLRRWLQRDPLGYVDGMSLYEYVGSGPTGGLDPLGMRKKVADCPKDKIVPRPGHKPGMNGCGPAGGSPLFLAALKAAQIFGAKANFDPACNIHDVCYDTCLSDKASCDRGMKSGMDDICLQNYANSSSWESIFTAFGPERRLARCLEISALFYLAISTQGDDAFESAQEDACICCE